MNVHSVDKTAILKISETLITVIIVMANMQCILRTMINFIYGSILIIRVNANLEFHVLNRSDIMKFYN